MTGPGRRFGPLLLALTLAVAGCTRAGAGARAASSGGDPPPSASAATASSATTTAPPSTLAPTARPAVADDPTTLAAQLLSDERLLRDPAIAPTAAVDAARRQQVAYRVWGRHPEWDATILPLVPAPLVSAVQRNLDARRHLVALTASRPTADTLPAWRITAPAPVDELLADYHEGEATFGVGWAHLAAINLVETGFGRIQGLSSAGAQGPMQFMPATWARYGGGGDITSPHDSILGAARYLAANGFAAGNVDGALRHYNQSDDYVAAVDDYAAILAAEPSLLAAYHAWDVYYFTTAGDVLLPVGYESAVPVAATDYLASHPQ